VLSSHFIAGETLLETLVLTREANRILPIQTETILNTTPSARIYPGKSQQRPFAINVIAGYGPWKKRQPNR
jgi:hypothetical protein